MTSIVAKGAKLSRSRLAAVGTVHQVVSRSGGRLATVSASLLAETRLPPCNCEDIDHMSELYPHVNGHLHAGMPVKALRLLASGCTTGRWVCPRLDRIRRQLGE